MSLSQADASSDWLTELLLLRNAWLLLQNGVRLTTVGNWVAAERRDMNRYEFCELVERG
jgi:hypothetical protein